MTAKRVLMLARDGDSTRIVYNALRHRFDVSAVVLEQPVERARFLRRRVEKLGVRTVVGQLAFRGLVVPLLAAEAAPRLLQIREQHQLDNSPIDPAVVKRVQSVNDQDCHRLLRELAPDLVVVNGTRIIGKATLEALRVPFINVHTGITPLYRGVHGGYWALAQGRPHLFGATIHLVDAGIDTGNILAQGFIAPTARDNFCTYPCLQYAAAVPLLLRTVDELLAGRPRTIEAPSGASQLWSHPTIGQYLANRLFAGVR